MGLFYDGLRAAPWRLCHLWRDDTFVVAQADGSPYDLSAMVLRWTTTGAGTFSKDQTQGAVLQVGAGLVQIPLSAAETAALAPRTLLYGRLADTITGLAWDLPPILVGP